MAARYNPIMKQIKEMQRFVFDAVLSFVADMIIVAIVATYISRVAICR